MNKYMEERNQKGFTLIELLVAIVVVGILTAVAIVGIAGLTDKGSGSACSATFDAVRAAEAVHYANTSPTVYPTKFSDLTAANELQLSGGASVNAGGDQLSGSGWILSITGGGGATPLAISPFKSDGTTPLPSCK